MQMEIRTGYVCRVGVCMMMTSLTGSPMDSAMGLQCVGGTAAAEMARSGTYGHVVSTHGRSAQRARAGLSRRRLPAPYAHMHTHALFHDRAR
jgi:hypothetical protein